MASIAQKESPAYMAGKNVKGGVIMFSFLCKHKYKEIVRITRQGIVFECLNCKKQLPVR